MATKNVKKKMAKKAQKPAKAAKAKPKLEVVKGKPAAKKPGARVKLIGAPSRIDVRQGAWVVYLPRFGDEGTHQHTYGKLTPYFEALSKGKLLATKCVNAKCPVDNGVDNLWLPPRADCPDCHQPMKWQEVKKTEGYIYTYTFVEHGGSGLELETPYYQIDVKIPGVATIVKSWLRNRDRQIKIGDKVRAVFNTGRKATHTSLDLSFELI